MSNNVQWRNRIVGNGEEAPDQLLANPKNWRAHPGNQQEALLGILREVGIVDDVIVNQRTGFVVDGHLRIALAMRDNQKAIPVKYVDLDEREEDLILATFDPISALAATDNAKLEALLRDVTPQAEAVQQLLDDLAHDAGIGNDVSDADAEPQIDRAAKLNEKWQVQRGDLWRIGEHRLLCGDSTLNAEVDRVVCGDSVAFVSDVPYGIDVDTSWLSALNVKRGKPPNKNDDRLANDDGSLDLSWAYKFKEWLVFGFPFVARDEAYTGLLVWDKRGDGGENGLGNPVEVAASNAFNGYRLARHVWAGYVREAGEKREDHPTQKPLGIMIDAVKLVKNQNILDPFVGSGTTLVACQNLRRKCRAIEISPNYCAVILERMAAAFPGIEIERLTD